MCYIGFICACVSTKYAFYAAVIVVGLICIVYRWICQSQSWLSTSNTDTAPFQRSQHNFTENNFSTSKYKISHVFPLLYGSVLAINPLMFHLYRYQMIVSSIKMRYFVHNPKILQCIHNPVISHVGNSNHRLSIVEFINVHYRPILIFPSIDVFVP